MSPDDSLIIAGKQMLGVILQSNSGRVTVDIRYQYKDNNGRMMPDRRGVTFNAEHIKEVIESLEKLHKRMIADNFLIYDYENSEFPKINPNIYPLNF